MAYEAEISPELLKDMLYRIADYGAPFQLEENGDVVVTHDSVEIHFKSSEKPFGFILEVRLKNGHTLISTITSPVLFIGDRFTISGINGSQKVSL